MLTDRRTFNQEHNLSVSYHAQSILMNPRAQRPQVPQTDHISTHDADTILGELGVDDEKRLKCDANVPFCINNAIDKTFKDSLFGS